MERQRTNHLIGSRYHCCKGWFNSQLLRYPKNEGKRCTLNFWSMKPVRQELAQIPDLVLDDRFKELQ